MIDAARRHPCFYAPAGSRHGRVHLPVAAGCNLTCAYCRRDHDCPNESRPGVSSTLLTPGQAADHLDRVMREMPYISVAAVAGPGDAFHDPDATLACLAEVRRRHPDLILCVSTNGLNLAAHLADLAALGVRFLTITINAVDPDILAGLCLAVRYQGRLLGSRQGTNLLIEQQSQALAQAKALGFTVKVNTVVVEGLNSHHVPVVARRVAELGADLMNLIPLIPVQGTPLAHHRPPEPPLLERLRIRAGRHLPQMRHCRRCRSDAAGLLGDTCRKPA